MSRRLPPSLRPDRQEPARDVLIGIKPHAPRTRIGILIRRVEHGKRHDQVIAPDEAIYLAKDEDDPMIRERLLKLASRVGNADSDLWQGLREKGDKAEIMPPTILGPHALKAWVMLHRELWQEAFARTTKGGSDDVVVTASPKTERLTDPPEGFDIQPRKIFRHAVIKAVPSLINPFSSPARPGYFLCFSSCPEGRFKGSFEGLMAINAGAPQR